MYSQSTYRGQPYVRTQRSAQFRWVLMGIGAATLGVAGTLTYHTFTNEYQQARSIAETAVIAEQVETYQDSIAAALAKADQTAAEIGNEVADPALVDQFSAMRNQARTVLATQVEVPETADGAQEAYLDREVANGILAINAAMPANLEEQETKIRASHEAYQELVDAKADAAAARAELEAAIPPADQLLFDTAPSADGWIYVEEELRVPLSEAVAEAHNQLLAADSPDLKVVDDFKKVANDCRAAKARIAEASEVVSSNIKMPEPVVMLDENGNPIPVEAPAEAPAETPPTE